MKPLPPIFMFLVAFVLTVLVCYSESLRPHRDIRDALKAAGWFLFFFCICLLANAPYWILQDLKNALIRAR